MKCQFLFSGKNKKKLDQIAFSNSEYACCPDASYQVSAQSELGFLRCRKCEKNNNGLQRDDRQQATA